jgi:hypothetical protein
LHVRKKKNRLILHPLFTCPQKWLDDDHVLVGTKCNTLLDMNVRLGFSCPIILPPAPYRSFSTHTPGWGACGIHAMDINPSRTLLAVGGSDPADMSILSLKERKGRRDYPHVQTMVVSCSGWGFFFSFASLFSFRFSLHIAMLAI